MLRQVAPEITQRESAWRVAAAWAMPWLLSSSTHLAILLLMALLFRFSSQHGGGGIGGATTGLGLRATFESREPIGVVGVEVSPSGGMYFEDEAPVATSRTSADALPFSEALTAADNNLIASDSDAAAAARAGDDSSGAAAGGAGTGGALGAVLGQAPGASFAALLPSSGSGGGPGKTALEGGGVGGAARMTKGPAGNNILRRGYASTGVFGTIGQGHKFAYVFDRSGSMDGHGGAPLAAAKSQLLASLEDLGPTHQFQIVFYNEHPRIFNLSGSPGRLVFGSDQNKRLAHKFIGGMTADGGTQHEEALLMALRMAPDVIFFLTDADEPQMTSAELQKIAQRNNGTSINAIEFGFGPRQTSDNFLVRLARQNGGEHVYVDVSQLPRIR